MSQSRVHENLFVMDAHCDTALLLAEGATLQPRGKTKGHVDLPRLRQGGVNVQIFALWVHHERYRFTAVQRCLTLLDAVWRELENNPQLYPVLAPADFQRSQAEDKVGILLSIEDGAALGGSLAVLRMFYRLGVRALGLTWNGRNELADGVGVSSRPGGLTSFGREVVAEMERLGMVIDVSHLAEPGFWDVFDLASKPFIASHSNARAICDHPRNLTDAQIKAVAEKGGVIGINFFSSFLTTRNDASIDDVVGHIEYMFDLVGPDYVGIGSDFDGISKTPSGLQDVSCLPTLSEALLKRGHTMETVAKVMGENFRRVFAEVMK